jgi:hypothetical protein
MKDEEVEQEILRAYKEGKSEKQISDTLLSILKDRVSEKMKAEGEK